jgi:tetratricopeptide (TPR) repeat protein
MSLAILGSMGVVWLLDMRHKCTEKVRIGTLSTVALGLAGFFPFQLKHESMRDYVDAKNYSHAYLDALPQNAIIATYCDNSSHPAAYEHFAHDVRPDLYFTLGMPQTYLNMEPAINWNSEMKKRFLTEYIETPSLNPLSLPRKLTQEEIQLRPLYTEFISGNNPHSAENCIPYGFLVQLVEHKTSNAEVIAADQEFQAKHPELFEKPVGTPHRLSREAFSYAHLRRGLFFIQRKLYSQAKVSLELALAWSPKNPQILFPYGSTLEELKDYEGAEKAYLDCIQVMPDFPNPRQNLALLYSYGKDYPRALELAKEELLLTKGAKNTQQLIAVLEQKMTQSK